MSKEAGDFAYTLVDFQEIEEFENLFQEGWYLSVAGNYKLEEREVCIDSPVPIPSCPRSTRSLEFPSNRLAGENIEHWPCCGRTSRSSSGTRWRTRCSAGICRIAISEFLKHETEHQPHQMPFLLQRSAIFTGKILRIILHDTKVSRNFIKRFNTP